MDIRFVNHASFVCEHAGVRLPCDPWLYGSAFNDGWDLIVESGFTVEQFADIDYIWFSHEHPDHFSPRVLLDIPKALRPEITVLYKQTSDQKVLEFCRKQGFAGRELHDRQRTDLGSGLTVTCSRVPLHALPNSRLVPWFYSEHADQSATRQPVAWPRAQPAKSLGGLGDSPFR